MLPAWRMQPSLHMDRESMGMQKSTKHISCLPGKITAIDGPAPQECGLRWARELVMAGASRHRITGASGHANPSQQPAQDSLNKLLQRETMCDCYKGLVCRLHMTIESCSWWIIPSHCPEAVPARSVHFHSVNVATSWAYTLI
jgi:hypothetical protein